MAVSIAPLKGGIRQFLVLRARIFTTIHEALKNEGCIKEAKYLLLSHHNLYRLLLKNVRLDTAMKAINSFRISCIPIRQWPNRWRRPHGRTSIHPQAMA